MINVRLLQGNNIITIDGDGKLPIKSSTGYMFYSPEDLLCAAVGACIGKQLIENKVNVDQIQEITVFLEELSVIQVEVILPLEYEKEKEELITNIINTCPMAKLIEPVIHTKLNKVKVKKDTLHKKSKGCCG